jgi:prepilin-type N-terminal cleavage/methylation domain-containing protein
VKIFMRHDKKMEGRREQSSCADNSASVRRSLVAVDWHDCAWSPQIVVQAPPRMQRRSATKRLPAPPQILHTPRRNPIYFKTMKTILPSSRRTRAGFTLVELLVVIAIIAILAAMLLSAINYAVRSAKVKKALVEEQEIVTAIESYDSEYGRFPVSAAAQAQADKNAKSPNPNPDFTYGWNFSPTAVFTPGLPLTNDEVIAILMDMQTYPGTGTPTINNNHVKNPKQTKFLNAHMSGDTSSPGVGPDLVYRDPWGNPYVITMDLNYDDQCEDWLYCRSTVSQQSGNSGYFGLFNPNANTPGKQDQFQYHGKVMVWSAGPDKKVDNNAASGPTAVFNKDNVLSWQ